MGSKLHQSYPSSKKGGLVTRVFGFALASFAALGVAFFVNGGNAEPSPVVAEDVSEVTAPDFSGETEAPTDLKINLTTSAITETSHTFRVSASSTTLETLEGNSRKSFLYLVVQDENWTDFETANEDGRTRKEAAVNDPTQTTDYEVATYNAYVYNITNSSSERDLVIPRQVYYSRETVTIMNESRTVYNFILNVVGISTQCCSSYTNQGEWSAISYNNINSISIPSSVEIVDEDAFEGAADAGVTINLEKTQAEVEALYESTWNENWVQSGATINYGYDYEGESSTNDKFPAARTTDKAFGVDSDFTLGSYTQDSERPELYQPMWVQYSVIDSEGNPVEGYQNLLMQQPLSSTNSTVDAVGSKVGSTTLAFSIDFEVPSGCEVDPDSIIFHNIYYAENQTIGSIRVAVPLVDQGAFYATAGTRYSQKRYISSFFTYEFGAAVAMADYTGFPLKMTTTQNTIYPLLKQTQYNVNKDKIDSGAYEIRMLFDPISVAYYRAIYEYNGELIETRVRVSTPIGATRIYNGTNFMFLIRNSDIGEGFSYESLRELYLEGFTVKMDIFDIDNYNDLTGTSDSTRFASMSLLPSAGKESAGRVDLIAIMWIVYIIFVIASAAITVVLYFYKKRKYRNDEFRRMNGKLYLKRALLYIFGAFLITSSLMFIVFRWGYLNNTVVVYNPTDVFVIIFTVAALIAVGVFIKNAVVAIKQSRERKEKARLHLDEDVVDDGTK